MSSEYQVFLNGEDVSSYIISRTKAPQLKPEWGQIPALKNMTLVARSDDYFFHPTHPVSLLHGVELDKINVTMLEFGNIVWRGNIVDTKANLAQYKTSLICETQLQKSLNQIARVDTDLMTAAEAAKRLLALYDIPFDPNSFGKADEILTSIGARIRMNPSILEWDGTLADLLQTISVAGIGRFFLTSDGSIGFDTYVLDTEPTTVTEITDQDLMQHPILNNESMNPIEGYAVKYLNGEETFGTNRKSFNFSGESAVIVVDNTTAIYIGETWLNLSHREYLRLDLHVRKEESLIVQLGNYIQLNSVIESINQPAEVIGIDNSDKRWIKFTVRIDKAVI